MIRHSWDLLWRPSILLISICIREGNRSSNNWAVKTSFKRFKCSTIYNLPSTGNKLPNYVKACSQGSAKMALYSLYYNVDWLTWCSMITRLYYKDVRIMTMMYSCSKYPNEMLYVKHLVYLWWFALRWPWRVCLMHKGLSWCCHFSANVVSLNRQCLCVCVNYHDFTWINISFK